MRLRRYRHSRIDARGRFLGKSSLYQYNIDIRFPKMGRSLWQVFNDDISNSISFFPY